MEQKGLKKQEYIQLLKYKLAAARKEVEIYEELIEELGADSSTDNDTFQEEDVQPRRRERRQERQEEEAQEVPLTKDGLPDKRFKENETEAIRAARHMEHGDDGRGEVRNEETDLRLKENEEERQSEGKKRQQRIGK